VVLFQGVCQLSQFWSKIDPMTVGADISIAKAGWSLIRNPVMARARKAHIWLFHWRTKSPPFDQIRAQQIAFSVLAGDIMEAASFRNIDSPRIFIACVRRSSEIDSDPLVYVLEQVGDAFKVAFRSDRLWFFQPSTLEVCDANNDGYHEVVFEDAASGSGAGMRRLMVYSSRLARLFTITESREWQNRSGPISPEIEIQPAGDREMLQEFESVARKRGYLQPQRFVDFDQPEFAVQRWHKENGTKQSGAVRIHYYQGQPECGATVVAKLRTATIHWVSFFKGPVYGYERLKDRHFIAYSSAWSYNWATCFAFDGKTLWFGLHMRDGLMSYSLDDSCLNSYEVFDGASLPRIDQLELYDGSLILNGSLRIPVRSLTPSASVQSSKTTSR
jgi:hypothetical protein